LNTSEKASNLNQTGDKMKIIEKIVEFLSSDEVGNFIIAFALIGLALQILRAVL